MANTAEHEYVEQTEKMEEKNTVSNKITASTMLSLAVVICSCSFSLLHVQQSEPQQDKVPPVDHSLDLDWNRSTFIYFGSDVEM